MDLGLSEEQAAVRRTPYGSLLALTRTWTSRPVPVSATAPAPCSRVWKARPHRAVEERPLRHGHDGHATDIGLEQRQRAVSALEIADGTVQVGEISIRP